MARVSWGLQSQLSTLMRSLGWREMTVCLTVENPETVRAREKQTGGMKIGKVTAGCGYVGPDPYRCGQMLVRRDQFCRPYCDRALENGRESDQESVD